jgi:hypothetical protein
VPALPNVSKVVRVDYHIQDDSDLNSINRFFMSYTGSLSNADAQTWVDAIAAQWLGTAGIGRTFSNVCALVRTELTDLTSPSSAQAINSVAYIATKTEARLGAGTAAVISFKIARRYRGGHPRMYIGGRTIDTLLTSQTFQPGELTAVHDAWTATIDGCRSAAPSAVGLAFHTNVSYYQGFHNVTYPSGRVRPVPTLRTGGPLVDQVTGYAVNPKVASQRRRNLQSS